MSRVAVAEEPGLVVARYRRDAFPYESEMYAYPPGEAGRDQALYGPLAGQAGPGRVGPRERGQLERQALLRGRADRDGPEGDAGLGEALQRLLEDSWRRDREAAYLAQLLRAWNELGQPEPRHGYLDDDDDDDDDDNDDGAAGRYGNRRGAYQAGGRLGLEGEGEGQEEEEADDGGAQELEEQVVRYLVGRILSKADAHGEYPAGPPRLVKRDLPSVPGPRRLRRSLGRADLLRVKRVGGGEEVEEEEEEEEEGGAREGPGYPAPAAEEAQIPAGLQRTKRIEGAPLRTRRYVGYQGAELAERLIKLLPD
ncbi:proprotein convertase subtilisin/kexin type 1 inhibitor, like [Carcharodon carcharias]|uniref:proprotein convertase subtilisin/kexin type 1 inhibitor, like n=1 Tax=Carcharodon carcharias TaxID=13397 RepID=UPI001B7E1ADB|nr:proprotein convertase subtilisin/kexin type 1 inhibitor, like [Carcharodon carcharias]